jgi:hypothetical protein
MGANIYKNWLKPRGLFTVTQTTWFMEINNGRNISGNVFDQGGCFEGRCIPESEVTCHH